MFNTYPLPFRTRALERYALRAPDVSFTFGEKAFRAPALQIIAVTFIFTVTEIISE